MSIDYLSVFKFIMRLFLNQSQPTAMQREGIDWYSISKLHLDGIDLNKFNQIIANAHPEIGIDRVTFQYRKKLLLLFQNASKQIKSTIPDLMVTNSQLQIKRTIIADKLQFMQADVECSFKEISNLKLILAEKKRVLVKLRDKVAKKQKQNAVKVYCCTICNREDFNSAEAFRAHFDKQHQEVAVNNNYQMNQFKDLLMTMKDKEMEMMSMFFRASREFQTQQLENDYDKQYKKYMHVSGTKTDESKQEELELEELKGQSQFLFFQKSEQFRREMERDQQFRRKLSQQKSQRQTLNNQFYQPNNYYNVFGSVEENTSQHIEEQRSPAKPSEEKQLPNYGYYDPREFLSRFIQKHQNVSSDSRCTLIENTPKPYVELKQVSRYSKEDIYAPPSISDRLRLQNNKKSTAHETMYSAKRKNHEEKGYAFNSGPLLDDKGEGSDYEDYFGKDKTLNVSIQDEEIKVNNFIHNISNYQGSKDSLYLSKLLSPKNQSNNSLLDKSIKEKSSELIDFEVSDSFSKRDFEISKDDETINLSDLKLSKLQRKKEEEKFNKYKQKDRVEQKPIFIEPLKDNFRKQTKQPYENILAQYEKRPVVNTAGSSSGLNILKQFERPTVVPLVQGPRAGKGNKRQLDQYIRK